MGHAGPDSCASERLYECHLHRYYPGHYISKPRCSFTPTISVRSAARVSYSGIRPLGAPVHLRIEGIGSSIKHSF